MRAVLVVCLLNALTVSTYVLRVTNHDTVHRRRFQSTGVASFHPTLNDRTMSLSNPRLSITRTRMTSGRSYNFRRLSQPRTRPTQQIPQAFNPPVIVKPDHILTSGPNDLNTFSKIQNLYRKGLGSGNARAPELPPRDINPNTDVVNTVGWRDQLVWDGTGDPIRSTAMGWNPQPRITPGFTNGNSPNSPVIGGPIVDPTFINDRANPGVVDPSFGGPNVPTGSGPRQPQWDPTRPRGSGLFGDTGTNGKVNNQGSGVITPESFVETGGPKFDWNSAVNPTSINSLSGANPGFGVGTGSDLPIGSPSFPGQSELPGGFQTPGNSGGFPGSSGLPGQSLPGGPVSGGMGSPGSSGLPGQQLPGGPVSGGMGSPGSSGLPGQQLPGGPVSDGMGQLGGLGPRTMPLRNPIMPDKSSSLLVIDSQPNEWFWTGGDRSGQLRNFKPHQSQ